MLNQISTGYFGVNHFEWSVAKLYKLIAERGTTIQLVPLRILDNIFENTNTDEEIGSVNFVKRAESTDLNYPIIIIDYWSQLSVADGLHRLWKAKHITKMDAIQAYILNFETLPENL